MAELPGFTSYRYTNWMGVYVQAKSPQTVADRLATEIAKIVREPAIRERLLASGVEPVGGTRQEFSDFLKGERETYTRVAKERGIRTIE